MLAFITRDVGLPLRDGVVTEAEAVASFSSRIAEMQQPSSGLDRAFVNAYSALIEGYALSRHYGTERRLSLGIPAWPEHPELLVFYGAWVVDQVVFASKNGRQELSIQWLPVGDAAINAAFDAGLLKNEARQHYLGVLNAVRRRLE